VSPHLALRCAQAVMAKAPQAGRSKTRLAPALGLEQAAMMSAAFLRDMTENIRAAAVESPIDGHIAYAPAGLEHLFDGHLAPGTGLVLADGNIPAPADVQGFGRCLLHAVGALLAAGYGAACVVNSDSPTLPTEYLQRAADLLIAPGERAVLGPADDGGYYLLGVKTAHAHLFANISWSTETVAAQTLQRAKEIGLPVHVLPSWYDVDDAASLRRMLGTLRGHDGTPAPFAAPATVACMSRLGLPADAV
jgi:rSAM/selenodomain-associated transferase 1